MEDNTNKNNNSYNNDSSSNNSNNNSNNNNDNVGKVNFFALICFYEDEDKACKNFARSPPRPPFSFPNFLLLQLDNSRSVFLTNECLKRKKDNFISCHSKGKENFLQIF
jgi:hypothetical protein